MADKLPPTERKNTSPTMAKFYKVDGSGNLTLFAADTGMDVVGAGVSTCAPTE